MPNNIIVQNIAITAAGGTFTLPTATPVNVYTISGTATLVANVAITSSGTLTAGLEYNFDYNANLTHGGNTFSIMGTEVPIDLLLKQFKARAYYNGSAWEVEIVPDFMESGIIQEDQFVVSPYPLVDSDLNGVTSVGGGTEETIATLTVPANTLINDGDTIKLVAWGTVGPNANAKTIKVKSSTNISPIVTYISNTTTGSPNGLTWRAEVYITKDTNTGGHALGLIQFNNIAPEIKRTFPGSNYTWSGMQEFIVTATSAGGVTDAVECQVFIVEKILA